MMADDEICVTCQRPHGVDGYKPRHPFRRKDEPANLNPSKGNGRGAPVYNRFPFDPVLRQALIDKGVLTVDDLRDAEAKILVTTGQFQDAVRDAMQEEVTDDNPRTTPRTSWAGVRPGTPTG